MVRITLRGHRGVGGRSIDTARKSIGKKRKSGLKVYYTNVINIVKEIDFLRELNSVEDLDRNKVRYVREYIQSRSR